MRRRAGRPDGLVRFATLQEWLGWQEQLHPRSIDLDLERVRAVAERLALRSLRCPVITVGGTNGKGSCVAFLESILTAAAYRVGTFTSPHLVRYNERIRLAGREVTDAELIAAFERIDAARGDTSLTFFEFNTLAALFLFQQERFDALVLEVGLGGRLDAVNIVDPDVAVLTSVGLDHCDWLGTTLEAIGREKAGIFRPGRPAVLGSRDMPESVFETARTLGAELRVPGVDYRCAVDGEVWHWQGREQTLNNLPLPHLAGRQQLANAATALAALAELRTRLPLASDHVATGVRQVRLRGRFEIVKGNPEWILDVAHNPAAAEILAQGLRDHPRAGRTLAIIGILADKDAAGVVKPLQPEVDTWIATSVASARGVSAAEFKERVGAAAQSWQEAASVTAACELALTLAAPADRIVVFGSFHTVGPAIEWLARPPVSSAILARPQFG
jgi:dihydrofolate synthase/folylpolyglutamate synthase